MGEEGQGKEREAVSESRAGAAAGTRRQKAKAAKGSQCKRRNSAHNCFFLSFTYEYAGLVGE